MQSFDLIIIGAGPAGMAAATEARRHGASVLVLEEQPGPGGQIYRNITGKAPAWLGASYTKGAPLAQAFARSGAHVIHGATVWSVEPGGCVTWSKDGVSTQGKAQHVLICTGAQERPMPFPGWTQPGVMLAGAAQILMKSSGLVPANAILAGSGPLLYQIAVQMIDAGAPPLALVETQTIGDMRGALRHLPKALRHPGVLARGLGMLLKIRTAGVKRFAAAQDLAAEAQQDGRIAFRFTSRGHQHQLPCDLLLAHQGVIPSTVLTRAAGIPHRWSRSQWAMQPVADAWGRTDVPGLWLAGDGAGILGATAAEATGRLAALGILCEDGRISPKQRDQRAAPVFRGLNKERAVRPFLDAAYPPSLAMRAPADAVVACRCEEVTCGDLRRAIAEGADGLRRVKTATRAGMGPCQGRMCDPTVRALLSEAGCTIAEDASPRARWPAKPVTLGELAALEPAVSDPMAD